MIVCNFDSDSISIIETGNDEVGSSLEIGQHPSRGVVTLDNSRLYVSNFGSNSVAVYDIDMGRRIHTLNVGSRPDGLALTPDQNYLLVLDTQSGDVTVIQKRKPHRTLETTEYSLLTLIPVGMQPNAIVVKTFMASKREVEDIAVDAFATAVIHNVVITSAARNLLSSCKQKQVPRSRNAMSRRDLHEATLPPVSRRAGRTPLSSRLQSPELARFDVAARHHVDKLPVAQNRDRRRRRRISREVTAGAVGGFFFLPGKDGVGMIRPRLNSATPCEPQDACAPPRIRKSSSRPPSSFRDGSSPPGRLPRPCAVLGFPGASVPRAWDTP